MLSTMILTSLYSNMYWVIAAAAAQLVILSMSSSTNAIRTEAERGCEPPCGRSSPWAQMGLASMSINVQSATTARLRSPWPQSRGESQRTTGQASEAYGPRPENRSMPGRAVVGKAVIGWVVEHIRRPSVLMFILGGIIATSVVVMSATGPTYELHKITRLIWRIV
eukprot:s427_g14.t2